MLKGALPWCYGWGELFTCDITAHLHAYENVKVLYRDISVGNIILTDEGGGLLIDWELVKLVDDDKSRRPDRTVSQTTQDISVAL